MIKYVVFDFDGTLADSKEVLLTVLDAIAVKHRLRKVDRDDINRLIKLPIAERCKAIGLPLYKIPLLAQEFYRLYEKNLHLIRLIDGMRELLYALIDRGYGIAIISSNSEKNIRDFLVSRKIDGIKDVICSNNLFGKNRIIEGFRKKHGLAGSELIYVGDEQRDVIASKKCGVRVIWVDWGYDDIDLAKSENPDYIAYKPEDILKILEEADPRES